MLAGKCRVPPKELRSQVLIINEDCKLIALWRISLMSAEGAKRILSDNLSGKRTEAITILIISVASPVLYI